LPLLRGETDTSPHESYFYYRGNQLQAVRQGRWKLREAGGTGLYDLENDLGETRNLADRYPERVERMREVMRQFDRELKN
jgi:arylsulfatase A-like enzyme